MTHIDFLFPLFLARVLRWRLRPSSSALPLVHVGGAFTARVVFSFLFFSFQHGV